jgi:hypothetical protein
MRTELAFGRLAALVLAVALLVGLLAGGALALPDGAGEAVRFAAYSLLTLLLWHGTGMPLLALGAALLFGALDGWRATVLPGRDAAAFLAAACGPLVTGSLLFVQGKHACAESSPR